MRLKPLKLTAVLKRAVTEKLSISGMVEPARSKLKDPHWYSKGKGKQTSLPHYGKTPEDLSKRKAKKEIPVNEDFDFASVKIYQKMPNFSPQKYSSVFTASNFDELWNKFDVVNKEHPLLWYYVFPYS